MHIDARVAGVGLGCPEILIFNEAGVHARRRAARRAAAVALEIRGNDVVVVHGIERVHALMPIIAAERAASQTHLHDVVELAVAGEDFDLAIVQQIVRAADAWGDLLTPAELQVGEARGIISRQPFLVEANAQVERQAMAHLPGILNIELMSVLRCGP